jgi:PqqD family protein of HPr-rel-A system
MARARLAGHMTTLPAVWRPAASSAMTWRRFDDELVVYNDATGDTHHLSALGSDVLLALLRHPQGIAMDDLVRDITTRVEVSDNVDLGDAITRALSELALLRLASRSA